MESWLINNHSKERECISMKDFTVYRKKIYQLIEWAKQNGIEAGRKYEESRISGYWQSHTEPTWYDEADTSFIEEDELRKSVKTWIAIAYNNGFKVGRMRELHRMKEYLSLEAQDVASAGDKFREKEILAETGVKVSVAYGTISPAGLSSEEVDKLLEKNWLL